MHGGNTHAREMHVEEVHVQATSVGTMHVLSRHGVVVHVAGMAVELWARKGSGTAWWRVAAAAVRSRSWGWDLVVVVAAK